MSLKKRRSDWDKGPNYFERQKKIFLLEETDIHPAIFYLDGVGPDAVVLAAETLAAT